ncbi:MAG: hypothetical protein RR301_07105, partial [Clostridia bacterium]
MTVVQLRKLARENGVKLSAGIDKDGIVSRLTYALGEMDSASAQPAVVPAHAVEARTDAKQNDPDGHDEELAFQQTGLETPKIAQPEAEKVLQSVRLGADDVAADAVLGVAKDLERLQDAPLSADVTSVEPGANFRAWNQPQEQGTFRPVYRQAWQARSTAP